MDAPVDYTESEHSAESPKNASGWPLENDKQKTESKADPSISRDDWSDDEWWT